MNIEKIITILEGYQDKLNFKSIYYFSFLIFLLMLEIGAVFYKNLNQHLLFLRYTYLYFIIVMAVFLIEGFRNNKYHKKTYWIRRINKIIKLPGILISSLFLAMVIFFIQNHSDVFLSIDSLPKFVTLSLFYIIAPFILQGVLNELDSSNKVMRLGRSVKIEKF